MSYSEERDQLDELFGVKPARRGSGYSEELQAPPTLPAMEAPAPSPVVEIKKPVKLRPPGSLEAPPADLPPAHRPESRTAAAPPALPAEAPASPPAPTLPIQEEIDDEEFVALGEVPDFSDFDLPPAESKAPPAPPKETKPVFKSVPRQTPATPAPAKPAATPSPAAETQPARSPGPASTPPATATDLPSDAPAPSTAIPETEPAPASGKRSRRDIVFASDQSLSHQDHSGSLLQTHGLVKIYDGRTVVNGVDIHVRPGEIVGLLGPNGAGKTTSFYMIVGLVPPNGGQVLFNGHDVTTMPMYQRARLGMGYLPQEESIFRKLTVEENLLAVLETLDLSRQERLARCQELLERFSITHIRKNVALTCSGGEKRRLTIARSLVTMPSLLMLDEPFSGVDPIAVNEIQNIVSDLRKSGLAILITDHNARQTLELVDRAYLIYEGRVLREGTRDFLINDPVSRELYLGDRFTM
jgi:lipopolysaccharide export system ATP-binding protein